MYILIGITKSTSACNDSSIGRSTTDSNAATVFVANDSATIYTAGTTAAPPIFTASTTTSRITPTHSIRGITPSAAANDISNLWHDVVVAESSWFRCFRISATRRTMLVHSSPAAAGRIPSIRLRIKVF